MVLRVVTIALQVKMGEKLLVLSGHQENVPQIKDPLLAAHQHLPTGTATTKITTQKSTSDAHPCQCIALFKNDDYREVRY